MGSGAPTIYVYRTLPIGAVAAQQATLARVLFDMKSGAGERFYISPLSGTLVYADTSRLRAATRAPQLPSAADARKAAEQFILEKNRAVAATDFGRGTPRIDGLFPADLRHVATVAVVSPQGSFIDHWRSRFIGFLPTGAPVIQPLAAAPPPDVPQPAAIDPAVWPTLPKLVPPSQPGDASGMLPASLPVDGGSVEVRIGAGGEVIGVCSRWRPYASIEIATSVAPPPGRPDAVMYYAMDGDEQPQDVIAPYYLLPGSDEDLGGFAPASDRSLVVGISRSDGGTATTLTAMVSGGSGKARYAWGCWDLARGPSAGFEMLGTGPTTQLPAGAYNVVVDVEDTVTGAFARTQAVVYYRPDGGPR